MYNFYQDTVYTTFVANMKWQNCVRSGIRTHAHIRGPENSLMVHEKVTSLESGALDHSAILTLMRVLGNNNIPSGDQTQDSMLMGQHYQEWENIGLSEVGFEPTPTEVDCDLNAAP